MKNYNHYIIKFCAIVSTALYATPSSTFWAPSTAGCQVWATPHITYDSYFSDGAAYPTDIGLTAGILPFEKLQAEIGLDVLYPSSDPLYLSGKLCTPESSLFENSPGIGIGIYNVGFKKDISNYNVLYGVLQKSIPGIGGYVSLGLYHGLNETLFSNSKGDKVQTGFLAAIASPDIQIGLNNLKKINFVADIQTGKNILGAWGFGTNIYFADNVSLLTGPVFFLDKAAQPGGESFFWTAQLDVDIAL